MTVETAIISYILDTGDMLGVIDANVTEVYFHEERMLRSFVWLKEQWFTHHETPSDEAFRRQFPTYKIPAHNSDPLSFLIEELRKRHSLRLYQDGIPPLIDQLGVGLEGTDPGIVTTGLRTLLNEVEEIVTPTTTLHISEAIEIHLEDVLNRADNPVIGLPTGFPSIDDASGGMQPEQLIILGGAPKAGKSSVWLQSLLSVARHLRAIESVQPVVGVGFEMSNEEQQDRLLSFASGVSASSVQRGTFTDSDRAKLDKAYDELRKLNMIFVHDVASATTISGLAAQTRKYKPAALFVDGVYHMTDETATHGDNETNRMTHISRGLKRLSAGEGVPLYATTQALLSKMTKRREVTADAFGWTSAWAQDANLLMGIDRPDPNRPEAMLKVILARHMQGMEVAMLIDHTRGLIAETARGVEFEKNYGKNISDDGD